MCEYFNCNIRARFNILGESTPRFCNQHKTSEMINVVIKCAHNDCDIRPSFNILGESTPRYCTQHKKLNMINILNK